ncbi:MAG TPA: YciI family protein [Acidobacteriaceae bacterium]|nr:YciI family protein [Acidobacteriaceae bacterium]
MQYLVLIYENESRYANGYLEDEFAEYGAFGKKYAAAIKGGNALQPTATAKTVRVRGAKTVTSDGPFAETKEQLGGYYLVEAANIDDAVSMAAGIPAARNGSVEVRPIMVFS